METRKIFVMVVALLLVVMVPPALGATIYVDPNAPNSPHDGSTWLKAYIYLQDALDDASSDDEIWVAEGTYRADEDPCNPDGTGDRDATFQLINNVKLYGGFAPYPADSSDRDELSERDPDNNETILTGDIGNQGPGYEADNSHRVVTGSGTNSTAVIDGFTIKHSMGSIGGGLYNDSGSPTITDCLLTDNFAGNCGMYNTGESKPTVTDCVFSNSPTNSSRGMYNDGSSPTLTDRIFTENSAGDGGGMYNVDCNSVTLTNCTFTKNKANKNSGGYFGFGGGMSNLRSELSLTNCTFTGNRAEAAGGGMHNANSEPNLIYCTFIGNYAGDVGGGMANYSETIDNDYSDESYVKLRLCNFIENEEPGGKAGGIYNFQSSADLKRCTFTANKGRALFTLEGDIKVYNCIFRDNDCYNKTGAGIYSSSSSELRLGSLQVMNSLFTGNVVRNQNKGAAISSSGVPGSIINSTFCGNAAVYDTATGLGIAIKGSSGIPTVTNCIFWDNRLVGGSNPSLQVNGVTVTYSCIQNWTSGGTGNITSDPSFVNSFEFVDVTTDEGDPGDPCCTMEVDDPCLYDPCDIIEYDNDGIARTVTNVNTTTNIVTFTPCLDTPSEEGALIYNWGSNTDVDENFRLQEGVSPCIDAGDNTAVPADVLDLDEDSNPTEDTPLDLDMFDRFHNDPCVTDTGSGTAPIVNMGAYENGCFPQDHDDYDGWISRGLPACWCYPRQCHGDADGRSYGNPFTGYRYVESHDLDIMSLGWLVKEPPKGPGILNLTTQDGHRVICADFNHDLIGSQFAGYKYITSSDLDEMSLYWLVKEPPKGPGVPPDCLIVD